MSKTEQPLTQAATVTFELVKDTGKKMDVVVKAAKDKEPAVTESRPVLLTGDEAMVIALAKANEMGYSHISMQQENSEKFEFLAYNR